MSKLENKEDEPHSDYLDPQCVQITKCLPCSEEQKPASFCKSTNHFQIVQCTVGPKKHISCTKDYEISDQMNYFYFQTTSLIFTTLFLTLVLWRRRKIRNEHYRKLLNQIDNV